MNAHRPELRKARKGVLVALLILLLASIPLGVVLSAHGTKTSQRGSPPQTTRSTSSSFLPNFFASLSKRLIAKPPRPAYPSSEAIENARRWLEERAGRTSFAVVDSRGNLHGLDLHEHFQTASVVKVMMLVAYLQMLNAKHRQLSSADTALLYPMIHISDNDAASAVLSIVGGAALRRVANEAGMVDYTPGVGWWAYTQTSAADQAHFFFALNRLIPSQFCGYARGLLSGIEPSQSWGVPPVARPRWHVFFKTGALPSEGLFNEAARLERPGTTFTIAVFTSGDPSIDYGEQTIQGVAASLLTRAP